MSNKSANSATIYIIINHIRLVMVSPVISEFAVRNNPPIVS